MSLELLTPDEMARADRLAIERGPFSGIDLMRRAGQAVASFILQRCGGAGQVQVLCGPGNNGGDGYVVAEILSRSGVDVSLFGIGAPREGTDAALAAADCGLWPEPLAAFQPSPGAVVVDALFGAGLVRPVEAPVRRAISLVREAGIPVVAIDLPSGVSGLSGQVLGDAFQAAATVTFVRRKPGHLLQPGRALCGEIVVADIGIPASVVSEIGATCFVNEPSLWRGELPAPEVDAHKYSRGHVAVFSGGATATGAARLSALAAARIGAGAVTLLSPGEAVAANAAHLTSIMLRQADTPDEILAFAQVRHPSALVYGPGLSPDPETGQALFRLLDSWPGQTSVVIDASALTSLAHEPGLLTGPYGGRRCGIIVTPHEGEFQRLFPDLAADEIPSKVDRARSAAARIDGVVMYKGPDTVIAAPDGRAAINENGTPWLATAGSGDVLSGIVAGLLGQAMRPFEAACAAVWIHAEAARRFGPGLIAEDLPSAILPVIKELWGQNGSWGRP